MDVRIADLIMIMKQLVAVHSQLLTLSKQKRDILVSGDTNELMRVTTQEKKWIQLITSLEQQRSDFVRDFFRQGGKIIVRKFKMENLIEAISDVEERTQLTALSKQLIEFIDELKQTNDFNQQLTKMHLSVVNHSLDLLVGPMEQEATYHREVQSTMGNRLNRYDSKI